MAAIMAAQPLRIPSLLPRLSAPVFLQSFRIGAVYTRNLSHPLLPSLSIAIPAIQLNIPAWLGDIWESVLKAVPKKKTSHMKKRHRQMAGKALKDVKAVCMCPGCGQIKRTHLICPHCMGQIKDMWTQDNPSGKFV